MSSLRILFGIAAVLTATAPLRAQLALDADLRVRVEKSVNRGLDYLAETISDNGSFPGNHGQTTAIPALAGMAFLSAGHLPGEGPYGEALNRIIDYVLANPGKAKIASSEFTAYYGRPGNGRMYAHSIATLFLSEVSGMVNEDHQKKIDEQLPDAVRLLLEAQAVKKAAPHDGGWRYEPHSPDSDMSCSGWALMALRSARLNGAPIPDHAIDRAVAYVKSKHNEKAGTFGYQDGNNSALTLTGAGILCLELCGRHAEPKSLRAVDYLHKNFKNLPKNQRRLYGLYYTSQGLFQLGGDVWREFQAWMYDTWIPQQKPDGSWNQGEENSAPYQTSLCILAFTVPYRQLPIYQRDETVDE